MRWAGLDLSAAEGGELLGEIERTSAEAVEMMGRLLDFQRASHRAIGYVKADVGNLVADMCRHYEIAANEKTVALRVTRPARQMMHLVDADGLKFIVSNLVSNALKFLPEGGTVEVRLCESFSGCLLVVSDNGPGIHEHELPGIFNRFSKAANRPTAGESSSGLGLFIVRKLVLAMGGSLYVESAAGEGTAFVAEWPAEAIRMDAPDSGLQSV
jgi:signal transduction histidine kinase